MLKRIFISLMLLSLTNVVQISLGGPEAKKPLTQVATVSSSGKGLWAKCAVAASIAWTVYKGAQNYNRLRDIEKQFVLPSSVNNLEKFDLLHWRFGCDPGCYATAKDINNRKRIIKNQLKVDIKAACSTLKIESADLKSKIEMQKKNLREALFYLWGCCDTPGSIIENIKNKCFAASEESEEAYHPLDRLCGTQFLQTWGSKRFAAGIKSAKNDVESLKSGQVLTFFKRNILYIPSLYVWQWKLIPFASKAETLFLRLLRKYVRLCALYPLFEEACKEVINSANTSKEIGLVVQQVQPNPQVKAKKTKLHKEKVQEDKRRARELADEFMDRIDSGEEKKES